MSRSFAPSPTATVCDGEIPSAAAISASSSALRARSTIGSDHLAGQPPVDDLERVGVRVVQTELGLEPVGEDGEPAGHHRHREAHPLQGRDERPRSGGQADPRRRPVDRRHLEPGQSAYPLAERGLEVELTGHRRSGHRLHLGPAAGLVGQQLDHLVGDQGRVDVHHHQPLGPPLEAVDLDGDVDAVLLRDADQGRSASRRRRRRSPRGRTRSPARSPAARSGRCCRPCRRWRRRPRPARSG